MNSSMPLDAEYLAKLCSDTITLIDRRRTFENELYFKNFKEEYLKSWSYKIRKFFGCHPITQAEFYNKMVTQESTWWTGWPAESFYYERKTAQALLSAANALISLNVNNALQLQVAVDEFNLVNRTYKKLIDQDLPAYFNTLPLAA